jgi:hypothetical protein
MFKRVFWSCMDADNYSMKEPNTSSESYTESGLRCETVPSIYHAFAHCGRTFCPSRLPCNSAALKGSEVAWGLGPAVDPTTARMVPSRKPVFVSARVGCLRPGWDGATYLMGPSRTDQNRELTAPENPGVRGISEYDPPNGGREPGERLEAGLG